MQPPLSWSVGPVRGFEVYEGRECVLRVTDPAIADDMAARLLLWPCTVGSTKVTDRSQRRRMAADLLRVGLNRSHKL